MLKETTQSPFVLGNVGIAFAVGTFQITISNDRRSAVTGTGNKDGVKSVLDNEPVRVRINKIKPGCGASMTNWSRLDVGGL